MITLISAYTIKTLITARNNQATDNHYNT